MRRSLTKFITIVVIAASLEALVMVFETSRTDVTRAIYPAALFAAAMVALLALGQTSGFEPHRAAACRRRRARPPCAERRGGLRPSDPRVENGVEAPPHAAPNHLELDGVAGLVLTEHGEEVVDRGDLRFADADDHVARHQSAVAGQPRRAQARPGAGEPGSTPSTITP